ncbi:MAG: biotin/lipoyl-binding protein [Chitinophagaceae bacterium]|nr:biotin/lipoyl-binding protein [Chitinophagaceae bacterium]
MAEEQMTYEVKTGEFVFTFTEEQVRNANVLTVSPGHYHILQNNQSARVHITGETPTGKTMLATADGETFHITIKDELDRQLDKMGYGKSTGKHVKEIKAPMPGLVLEVAVTEGQEVAEGEKLLILEAMKMENSIMIPASARIKRVAVKAGQAVEKGQLLVELE